MASLQQGLRERLKEVDAYIDFLDQIERHSTTGDANLQASTGTVKLTADVFKILKANAFLLLYNTIEASVKAGFTALYEAVQKQSVDYEKACAELRRLWVHSRFRSVFKDTASWTTSRDKAFELLEEVWGKEILQLDARNLPISGNLNADKLRVLCEQHGFEIKMPAGAKGGQQLELVKEKRNVLGHGNLSFVECGREYSPDDIRNIRNEVVLALRAFGRAVDKHITNQGYLRVA